MQQLHGRLLGLRPDRRPRRRQAAFRHPHPPDRGPSRSSATGSWPSPARLARSKLAILGPPRMVAEVPEALAAACGLFSASGYVQETVLTDYVLTRDVDGGKGGRGRRLVIPVTVDNLAANSLLGGAPPSPQASPGPVHPPSSWERSLETLTARKDDIAGLAVASDERIEAYLLYIKARGIVSLRTLVDDGGARLNQLLSRLRATSRPGDPCGSRRSTRRRSRRRASRRSVSAPLESIGSTLRRRSPARPALRTDNTGAVRLGPRGRPEKGAARAGHTEKGAARAGSHGQHGQSG